jgi:hypothetical protein
MVMNKKGIIKTLEAIITIVLILVFIYTIMPKEELEEPENPIKKYEKFIIKDLSYNETIRDKLMDLDPKLISDCDGEECECNKDCLEKVNCDSKCKNVVKDINALISKTIISGYDYFFKICNKPSCISAKMPIDKSIYMFDVLISSDSEQINPMIVRIWVWNK